MQPLTPPQHKIIVAYRPSSHRLTMSRLSHSLQMKTLGHFCSHNVVDCEAHFVLECPLYNSINHKIPSLFQNVVLGSLKSSSQLDHQVDFCVYHFQATALVP